jgi:ribokinase
VAAYDVIVCGSLHLDIVVRAPALPRVDETAVGTSWQKVCGGKGGNQAVQAAKAGARAAFIGRVGRDEFGDVLRANLVAAGVDVSALSEDERLGSGMSVAILQDNGEYGAVIVSGANTGIDPAHLHQQWRELGGAKVLVLQNEVPHNVNLAAARTATAGNGRVVLNAAPARPMGQDLLDLVDVLVVNRVEAEAMCGLAIPDRAAARAAIAALGSAKRSVIITLGGDGLVVLHQDTITEIAAVPVVVTSTHGAGDCFVGTLSAALAAGASLLDACQTANLRAAAFVSRTEQDIH